MAVQRDLQVHWLVAFSCEIKRFDTIVWTGMQGLRVRALEIKGKNMRRIYAALELNGRSFGSNRYPSSRVLVIATGATFRQRIVDIRC